MALTLKCKVCPNTFTDTKQFPGKKIIRKTLCDNCIKVRDCVSKEAKMGILKDEDD